MANMVMICSPNRLAHLSEDASYPEVVGILPELNSNLPDGLSAGKFSMGWHGYTSLDEFVIERCIVLRLDGEPVDGLLYSSLLSESGVIGDILLYILDKDGGDSVATVLAVDDSPDDVVLSKLIGIAACTFSEDGFILTIEQFNDGQRLITIQGHFVGLGNRVASARASYLFTEASDLGLDVRLLSIDWNAQTYMMRGDNSNDPIETAMVDEQKLVPGSIEELMDNLSREDY